VGRKSDSAAAQSTTALTLNISAVTGSRKARGELSQSRKAPNWWAALEVSRGAAMPARRANIKLTLRVQITS